MSALRLQRKRKFGVGKCPYSKVTLTIHRSRWRESKETLLNAEDNRPREQD